MKKKVKQTLALHALPQIDRKTQALLALHDLGSREGATASKVKKAMIDEGFTLEEIAQAAKSYGGEK